MTILAADRPRIDVLQAIERRVLWLAVRIVDFANRERASGDELKVGGHQASSASIVPLLTALSRRLTSGLETHFFDAVSGNAARNIRRSSITVPACRASFTRLCISCGSLL